MASIILGNREFSYTVIKKGIRSLNLRLRSANSFVVSCPYLTPNFIVTRFIHQHEAWIVNHAAKFSPPTLFNSLTILDQEYELIFKKSLRSSVVFFEDTHQIFVNHSPLTPSSVKLFLDKKLRPHALRLINQDLRLLATSHHFHYGRVSIRNQSSRFGSCSSTGNLSFNWQIILFPRPIYLHILLHELTHTLHHNHSLRFWQQLEEYDPQWRPHRRWLRTDSQKYLIFSRH